MHAGKLIGSVVPVIRVIAIATILARFITPTPAIMVRLPSGAAVEVRYFLGTVTHVDQNRRTFAVSWQGKGPTKMEYYHPKFEETYRVTDATVYKGGSWANVTKGVMVRVTGHSDVADTVEFTNAGFNPEPNVQNARTYRDRGLAKQKKGDLDGAMADYNQAIKLDPKFTGAYNNRGNIKLKKGDLKGAMADYNQAIQLDSKYYRAYNNRGLVRFREGDLNGALADYNQAIALNPKYGLAYRNRGNAKQKRGDLNGAIADFDRAIKVGVTTD